MPELIKLMLIESVDKSNTELNFMGCVAIRSMSFDDDDNDSDDAVASYSAIQ